MTERQRLIQAGVIVPHADLYLMYTRQVPAPSFSQPWHRDDVGLRMDAAGHFWAEFDVAEGTVQS